MPKDTLTIVLAGGTGTRLKPLTEERAKPAVPFGGKYRIIDFTLANCLHSDLRRILVMTQYKSHSLQKHIRDGWSIFNPELGEYITNIPAQMRVGKGGYSGTADAIFQNLYLLERSAAKFVLILSGDHIYRMDYAPLIAAHRQSGQAVTIACTEIDTKDASSYGVVTLDENEKIVEFQEKPENPKSLPHNPDRALVSMGIYIFSIDELKEALHKDAENEASSHDFGHNIIPALISTGSASAYQFGGEGGRVTLDYYWRDVGTLDTFYDANMDLLKAIPPLNLYQKNWSIRTYQSQTPPARTVPGESGTEGISINSIIAGGAIIAGGNVSHSIIFKNVFVDDDAFVEDSLLFDGVHVGKNTRITKCIIDKNVTVPDGEEIGYDLEQDRKRFVVTGNGIVVINKGHKF
jgi:glucose-1-phosphate adenylyltransferase